MLWASIGVVLGVGLGIWFAVFVLKEVMRIGRTNPSVIRAFRILGLFLTVVFGAFVGMLGMIGGTVYPAPPRPVEESVVIARLVPFAKNAETDLTIWTQEKDYSGVLVRYQDNDGAMKTGLCCNGIRPQIKTVKEGETPAIKRYYQDGYIGWFALRYGRTWYEIYLPSTGNPKIQPPVEVIR